MGSVVLVLLFYVVFPLIFVFLFLPFKFCCFFMFSFIDLFHGNEVQVLLPNESAMYLGRKVCFNTFDDTEIQHRINKGWAAFGKHKSVLCCRNYPLHSRLRLFDATVSPTVLYGSGAWTMTAERCTVLKSTFRRMLRQIFGILRRYAREHTGDTAAEPWVDWIVRATHKAENEFQKAGFCNWLEALTKRKQRLYSRIQSSTDGRWAKQVLDWQPAGNRNVGRPVTRWTDSL